MTVETTIVETMIMETTIVETMIMETMIVETTRPRVVRVARPV